MDMITASRGGQDEPGDADRQQIRGDGRQRADLPLEQGQEQDG
ncbi:hypothetical protein [Streptomyces peucetius]|uniref:Uncharacterized protein n=1 Tax=Streptomyces peucetius TaxID=1950 RepID=A0ABY6IGV1_STRPE|nr:hypothetical protein [Streptomyces peucetius]UYQ66226.1 hypothetical protein OGH68_35430 [Streptomyces peucetius]